MKSALLLMALAPVSVLACDPELQFIGRAKEVNGCKFKIEFSMVNANASCPLDVDEVLKSGVEDCSVQEGQEISGYLIQRDGRIVLDQ